MTMTTPKITFAKDNTVILDGVRQSWYVREGSYSGTTDDRLGRWYVGTHGEAFRPYGRGHASRKAAVEAHLDDEKADA